MKKLTDAQYTTLEWLSKRSSVSTGPASNGLQGHSGSTLQALVRRGFANREFYAITGTTYYSVTDAGRTLLASERKV